METVVPSKDISDIVKAAGGDTFKLCWQCSLCATACPWNIVKTFIIPRMLRQAQFGLVDFESEEWWLCATCRACVRRCPRGVEIIDIMRAMRKTVVEFGVGKLPDSLRIAIKNISAAGNPSGEPAENRADWAKDLNVKPYTRGTEILYFSCCIPAYDPQVKRVARATASILSKAGVDFGILGTKEVCCGESARKAGQENLFQSLAESNIAAFSGAGVKKIVVTSPHCYNTFKNEYAELGGNFEVVHFSQYLLELIKEGKIKFTKELKRKVTYHDPCYLGRHNGIYDEPRQVLESIPGLELVEMPDYCENSLCCGGGGGRIWMETKKGERFSDIRLEQALGVGANILALACPYCMLNFEDSVLSVDKSELIQVRDIAELVLESI